jgi:hypothetical protein
LKRGDKGWDECGNCIHELSIYEEEVNDVIEELVECQHPDGPGKHYLDFLQWSHDPDLCANYEANK